MRRVVEVTRDGAARRVDDVTRAGDALRVGVSSPTVRRPAEVTVRTSVELSRRVGAARGLSTVRRPEAAVALLGVLVPIPSSDAKRLGVGDRRPAVLVRLTDEPKVPAYTRLLRVAALDGRTRVRVVVVRRLSP